MQPKRRSFIATNRRHRVQNSARPAVRQLCDSIAGHYIGTGTRVVLCAALDYYDRIGLENRKFNEKGLKAEFQNLENWNADGRSDSNAPPK